MFQYCRDKLFWCALAAYAINRWLLKPTLPPGEVFFRCYFNDVLLLPCALPLALHFHKLFGVRKHDLPPTLMEVVLHVCIWSVILELVSPHLFARSTADAVDVVAYASGGFLSWLFWNISGSRHSHRLRNDIGITKPNNADAPDREDCRVIATCAPGMAHDLWGGSPLYTYQEEVPAEDKGVVAKRGLMSRPQGDGLPAKAAMSKANGNEV